MRSFVDRNVVMRRMTVFAYLLLCRLHNGLAKTVRGCWGDTGISDEGSDMRWWKQHEEKIRDLCPPSDNIRNEQAQERSVVSGMQHAFQEREIHKKFPRNTKKLMEGGGGAY